MQKGNKGTAKVAEGSLQKLRDHLGPPKGPPSRLCVRVLSGPSWCAGAIVESGTRLPTSSRAGEDAGGDSSRTNLFGRNFLVRISDETTRVVSHWKGLILQRMMQSERAAGPDGFPLAKFGSGPSALCVLVVGDCLLAVFCM
eukprot:1159332-Pelagomonas_calceolata.AAC.4